jgi:histidinol-phosphate/aromatic aminotransferase/cobyric acid decarboxylase-like protein
MIPPPGDHGGDAATIAAALGVDRSALLDLSASLNPVAPDVAGAAGRHLASLDHYPDDGAATVALAEAIGVDPGRLVLTNGGAEAIALVAQALQRGEVIEPEFALYRRHLAVVEPGAGRWRSNPSNPLGDLAGSGERAVVWDEAFYPLATGRWTAAPDSGSAGGRADDRAWRLGSLTKLWACPGLRLGYVLAPDHASADQIRARRPRWSVNGLALAVVPELLAATDLVGWQRAVAALRAELTGVLTSELGPSGLIVRPSAANWVLVHTTAPLRSLLARQGVVVRDCGSFGLAHWYRVAVPARRHQDRVVSAFAQALGQGAGGDRDGGGR